MGEIYNQIGELTKKFTQEATKKSLTDKISRRLLELEFEESHSIKSKCLKFIVQKYYHHCKTCIAQAVKNTLMCVWLKKVIMANKVIREKSRYANYMAHKSRFLKQV